VIWKLIIRCSFFPLNLPLQEELVQNNQIIRENFSLPEECQQINVKEKIALENHHFTTNDSPSIINGCIKPLEEMSYNWHIKL